MYNIAMVAVISIERLLNRGAGRDELNTTQRISTVCVAAIILFVLMLKFLTNI